MKNEITITVAGERGRGKTTCLDEIVLWLEERDYEVVRRNDDEHWVVVKPPIDI